MVLACPHSNDRFVPIAAIRTDSPSEINERQLPGEVKGPWDGRDWGTLLPPASGGERPLLGVQKLLLFDRNRVVTGQSGFTLKTPKADMAVPSWIVRTALRDRKRQSH